MKSDNLSDHDLLELLASAISDVGYWNWWTAELPELVQVEFGRVQLYLPSENQSAPHNMVALQFRNPTSISFLTRIQGDDTHLWHEALHEEKMEGPNITWDAFSFTHQEQMTAILEDAQVITTIHGYSPKDDVFLKEKYKLVFWAGNFGMAIAAQDIKILAHTGEIALQGLPEMSKQWWGYLDEYWKRKDTIDPMPVDYTCEVTIPSR
ncbi:MAG: hypothetical protein ABJH04_06455 [Cyclobacteriaceae bacterium]